MTCGVTATTIDNPTRFSASLQGSLVRVNTPRLPQAAIRAMRAKRDKITGFSAKSRKRLLERVAKVRTDKLLVFITLTYIDPPTAEKAKTDLHNFLQHIRRHAPRSATIWRMEYQERGAIHFHLLCFNLPYWHKDNLRDTWARITGDPRKPRTRIEACRSRRKALSYVSKYMAKKSDSTSVLVYVPYPNVNSFWQGRIWGIRQAENIPYCDKLTFIFAAPNYKSSQVKKQIGDAYALLRERASKIFPAIEFYEWHAFTVFTDKPLDLLQGLTTLPFVTILVEDVSKKDNMK